jgi:hypothetical protein
MICCKTGNRKHSSYAVPKERILVAKKVHAQYFKSQYRGDKNDR